jgi:hypothetical protein
VSGLDVFEAAAVRTPRPGGSTGKRARIAFNVIEGDGNVRVIEPYGRDAWALTQLIRAGTEGCTPLTHVGPRWSAYVFKLKRIYGLDIETVHEGHGGEFKGTHARYVLRSKVQFAEPADATRHGGAQ